MPIDDPACADFVAPEMRGEIDSGSYSADLIAHLAESDFSDERVLVIGAGLGIVSSHIAANCRAERVLAVEADPRLVGYMNRLHRLNGVEWVEAVNAILTHDAGKRVPFYPQSDIRESSIMPSEGPSGQVMLVPSMDLNLILAEERIDTIVCEIPGASIRFLAEADLSNVRRIVIDCSAPAGECPDHVDILIEMTKQGFDLGSEGGVMVFKRSEAKNTVTPVKAAATG